MKKIIVLALATFSFATVANAATLSITSDQSTYLPGATVTLTITGDSQGASSTQVFAQLLWTGDSSFVSSSQVTQTSFGGGLSWASGALTSGAGFADGLNQIAGLSPLVPDNLFSATIVLTAGSVGIVNTSFNSSVGPNMIDFFGAPGTGGSFSIAAVPEPTTAALMSLGLVALALAGRRR